MQREHRKPSFLIDPSGAVTVDWAVLAAGVAAVSIMAASSIWDGYATLTSKVDADLGGEVVVTSVTFATADMTATSIWDDPTATSREFANVDQLSFSTVLDLSTTDEGIIFESGARGRGFVFYQYDGVIYLQAGDGSGFGEAADRGEVSWEVTDGTFTFEGSMNADGGLALYVNGELVDQSSFTAPSLGGGNAGAVGGGASAVARNRGDFGIQDGHPGVTEVVFFEDQVTGDELIPLRNA